MLASIGTLPGEPGWSYEIKWDGVRALAYVDDGRLTRLESRNLNDFTPRYPEIVASVPGALANRSAVLDGEVVGFDDRGRVSFGALQHRMHLTAASDVARQMSIHPVAFMVFDVLRLDGVDLMRSPYSTRRAALEALDLGAGGGLWQVPPAVGDDPQDGADLAAASRAQGLEGIVAKRLTSIYEAGKRSRNWLKIKNQQRQELVIGGWLPGAGNRTGTLGALLVGHYDGPSLRYAGRVGTGFTTAVLRDLVELLTPLQRQASPFADAPRLPNPQWVAPALVAEIGFGEWTAGGTLRHPVYLGLRSDADPGHVVREPVMGET